MVVLVGDAEDAARRATSTPAKVGEDADTLRLFAEELAVTRETVETGRVRIARITRTRDQPIDEQLSRETVTVETVPVGRQVDAIPAVRSDGDMTIIPVVEEVVVVERRLILKEELHVRRVRTSEQFRDTVSLRYQEAQVTRLPPQARAAADGTAAGAVSPSTQKEAKHDH
jgi:uncharacterized protein (TIGR02271 family)